MKKERFVEKTFHLTTACGGASTQGEALPNPTMKISSIISL